VSANAIGRRDFLRLVGAGTVANGVLPGSLFAENAPKARRSLGEGGRIRVGYQIYGWGRYFPSAWWKGAATVGALGYRGIEGEYTIAELYEGRDEEFEEGMRRCGVALAALYSTTDLERPRSAWRTSGRTCRRRDSAGAWARE